MSHLNLQNQFDVIMSFASHEVLSIADAVRHPYFNNVYFTYTESHFTFYFPFKNFCRLVAIPSDLFVPIDGKQTPFSDYYEPLQEQRSNNVKIINTTPCVNLSKVTVNIIDVEETTTYKNLFQGIYNKNVFWHIAPKKYICFIFIPHSSLCIKITISCELALPNKIWIDALRSVNKSNAKRAQLPPGHLSAKLSHIYSKPEIQTEPDLR